MVQNDLKRNNGSSESLKKKSRRYFVYVYMFPYQLKRLFLCSQMVILNSM